MVLTCLGALLSILLLLSGCGGRNLGWYPRHPLLESRYGYVTEREGPLMWMGWTLVQIDLTEADLEDLQAATTAPIGIGVDDEALRRPEVVPAIEEVAQRADVYIYSSGEGLSARGLGRLARVPSIRRIGLGAVDEDAVTTLLEMRNLEHLKLRTDNLSDEAVRRLLNHEGLRILTLNGPRHTEGGYRITDGAFLGLSSGCRLTRLELERADIGYITLEHLASCEDLHSLTLRQVPLSNDDWPAIVAIDSLRSLDVRETPLDTIEPLVEGLPDLQVLGVPAVSRHEVTALLALQHLQEVDLRASRLTAAQVQRLLDEHPSLHLLHASSTYLWDLRVPLHIRVEPNPYFTANFERPRRLRWGGTYRRPVQADR